MFEFFYLQMYSLMSNRRSPLFQPRSQLVSLQFSPRDSEFADSDIEMSQPAFPADSESLPILLSPPESIPYL